MAQHYNTSSESAYLVGIHRYAFRAGHAARIIGVEIVTPHGHEPRPCYKVEFADGVTDHVPVASFLDFAIISETDYREGRIPPVTR